jgi:hypothetical protein
MIAKATLKRALPEIEEEYATARDLFDEAWHRKYNGVQTDFDDKYCHLAVKLIQTLGYLIDAADEDL